MRAPPVEATHAYALSRAPPLILGIIVVSGTGCTGSGCPGCRRTFVPTLDYPWGVCC